MAFRTSPAVLALALVVSVTGVATARAQNFDGPGVLRFGVYGQGTFLDSRYSAEAGTTGTASIDDAGFGLSFGYDWRMDRVLVGAEADVTLINEGLRVTTGAVALDYLSTFRGRLGFYAWPGLLLYGTAGIALMNAAYEPEDGGRSADFMTGWVAGAGIEKDFNDLVLFAEYLHADFGEDNLRAVEAEDLKIDSKANTVRIGVKFKIGHDY